jgi:hypothetical protein
MPASCQHDFNSILGLSKIRDDVRTLVNSGDCADWIKQLIEQAQKSVKKTNPVEFTNPLDRLNEFHFSLGTTANGGSTSGSLKGGDATIHLMDLWHREGWENQPARIFEEVYASETLHEIIHLVGRLGTPSYGYQDYELALATHALPGSNPNLPIWHSDEHGNNLDEFSKYWDAELRKHCKFE